MKPRSRASRPGKGPVTDVLGPQTPHLYVPSAARPVRAKERWLSTDQRVIPHRHEWAQLAFSSTGVIRLTTDVGTYLVPPSRALWIPPGVEHAVSVVEDARLRTLYLYQAEGVCGPLGAVRGSAPALVWERCRVLDVSALLRALVDALDTTPDDAVGTKTMLAREQLIVPLLLNELAQARALQLGIALPQDKRLRQLCEAVIADPGLHARLDDWAVDVGASPRTLARRFREELGTSFGQWRRQVLLAQALALGARGRPVGLIAAELGYASASAFTAMVRRTVGAPPRRFLAG